jgi:hypothetical protein
VTRSSRLVDLQEGEDGLVATIDHAGKTEKISVRWVVGCDGLHSITRTLGRIEVTGHDLVEPWAVFDATLAPWSDSYEANYAYLDEIPVILTALPGRRWRVYLRPSSSESDLLADAMSTISRYLPGITFVDVAHPARFHCHTKMAKRYRSGRILLAGDAAHVCSPSQGHGMNSGLQDAFNLAWKLALVCQGHCSPALLDSYEVERRPVAKVITASGEAFERAQDVTNRTERRARDESLRAVFADPASRHHEAIAEAEFDIDYADSPIAIGDEHSVLAAGQRLPDTIEVYLAKGKTCMLHELTYRAGHTALLIGGFSVQVDALALVDKSIRARSDAAIIEANIMLTARHNDAQPCDRLASDAAERLGIDEITLLIIRPDGHVGLRADRDHLDALAAYQARLVSGGT